MAQHPIEIILLRQWASYMATPLYIVDPEGNLIYYNDAAAPLLGAPFEVAIEMPSERLADLFATTGLDGTPIPSSELPLNLALAKRIPAHQPMRIMGLDGASKQIEVTALPIVGESGRLLGAVAALWETEER